MTFGELTNWVLKMDSIIPDEAEVGMKIGYHLDNGKTVSILMQLDNVTYVETGKYAGRIVMSMLDEN